uniref:RING-type domain-containing protein n=1 Tax=Acanthochromis polyacanthus TaxID=80966 RepID=A0A3Q1GJ93_9TELE
MASTSTSPSEPSLLDKHITCSICMDVFKDPISTACGHSFCKDCLFRSFKFNDKQCPLFPISHVSVRLQWFSWIQLSFLCSCRVWFRGCV